MREQFEAMLEKHVPSSVTCHNCGQERDLDEIDLDKLAEELEELNKYYERIAILVTFIEIYEGRVKLINKLSKEG